MDQHNRNIVLPDPAQQGRAQDPFSPQYDPAQDPLSPQYDPTQDPLSPQYDPAQDSFSPQYERHGENLSFPGPAEHDVGYEGSLPFSDGEIEQKPPRSKGRMFARFIIEIAIALIIAFALTWCVKTFVLQPYEVPSGSMEPTIMIGDKIIADKLTFFFGSIEKGDIIVFQDKTQPDRVLVKRVIGLPGDLIDIQNGLVLVNGEALYEPYTHNSQSYPLPSQFGDMVITYPFKVPKNSVWVMGDNRENSADSRYFGPVDIDTVKGHVLMVFWPPSDISLLS